MSLSAAPQKLTVKCRAVKLLSIDGSSTPDSTAGGWIYRILIFFDHRRAVFVIDNYAAVPRYSVFHFYSAALPMGLIFRLQYRKKLQNRFLISYTAAIHNHVFKGLQAGVSLLEAWLHKRSSLIFISILKLAIPKVKIRRFNTSKNYPSPPINLHGPDRVVNPYCPSLPPPSAENQLRLQYHSSTKNKQRNHNFTSA